MPIRRLPNFKQPDSKYHGKNIPLQQLRTLSETVRDGSNMLGLSEAAEKIGFRTLGVKAIKID